MTESASKAPGRIFVNYRQEDSAWPASRLYDQLAERYGEDQIFKDIDALSPGDNFAEKITQAVASCHVLVAMIGAKWLTITADDGTRRLDHPNDWVRLEIETALKRDVLVIPILVSGAKMPKAGDLPASLEGLPDRQALEISPGGFKEALGRLFRVLDTALPETQPAPAPAPGEGEPNPPGWHDHPTETQIPPATPPPTADITPEPVRKPVSGKQAGWWPVRWAAAGRGLPVLAFGPLFLGLPLLILAVKVFVPSYPFTKSWALAVLCSAVLGGGVAAAEHGYRRIPVWTAALEFFFAWFVVYALYKLNIGHVHRIAAHVPPLAILAGVGAVASAVLCARALTRSPRKGGGVHPLLPAFLGCMVAGLGAAAIGYASTHYPAAQILQRIGPTCYRIGGVFLFAALAADLLAPLTALVRKLNNQ